MPSRLFLLTTIALPLLQSCRDPANLFRSAFAGECGAGDQVFAHFQIADQRRFVSDFGISRDATSTA